MGDQQTKQIDMLRERNKEKLQRAKELAEQWRGQHDEWRTYVEIRARFSAQAPHQLVDMMRGAVNERGKKLTYDEFDVLCELWEETFNEKPPLGERIAGKCNDDGPTVEPKCTKEELPHNQIISRKDVARLLNASVSTIDRMEKEGRLPRKRRISERRVGWVAAEIDAFIEAMDRKP